MTIKRLQSLKTMSDMIYTDSRKKLDETLQTVSKHTLVAQCVALIDKNKLSMNVRLTWQARFTSNVSC